MDWSVLLGWGCEGLVGVAVLGLTEGTLDLAAGDLALGTGAGDWVGTKSSSSSLRSMSMISGDSFPGLAELVFGSGLAGAGLCDRRAGLLGVLLVPAWLDLTGVLPLDPAGPVGKAGALGALTCLALTEAGPGLALLGVETLDPEALVSADTSKSLV